MKIKTLLLLIGFFAIIACEKNDEMQDNNNNNNQIPVADCGNDQTFHINNIIRLDGSNSSDPDGEQLSYLWSLFSQPNESLVEIIDFATEFPYFISDKEGIYKLILTVNDGIDNSIPDTIVITINSINDYEKNLGSIDEVSLKINNGSNVLENSEFENGLKHWISWDDEIQAYRTVNNSHSYNDNSYHFFLGNGFGSLRTFYSVQDTTFDWNYKTDIPYEQNSPIWIDAVGGADILLEFMYKGTLNSVFIIGLDSNGTFQNLHSITDLISLLEWKKGSISYTLPTNMTAVAIQFDIYY